MDSCSMSSSKLIYILEYIHFFRVSKDINMLENSVFYHRLTPSDETYYSTFSSEQP